MMLKYFGHFKRVNLVFGKKIQITLVNSKCYCTNFDCCKWQKIQTNISIHLVTLVVAFQTLVHRISVYPKVLLLTCTFLSLSLAVLWSLFIINLCVFLISLSLSISFHKVQLNLAIPFRLICAQAKIGSRCLTLSTTYSDSSTTGVLNTRSKVEP